MRTAPSLPHVEPRHCLARSARAVIAGAACCTLWFGGSRPAAAQGIFLTGVGPVNQSMASAAVAAPLDAAGALAWNSATISGLAQSELEIGLGLVLPTSTISSQVPGLAGETTGEPGVSPVPTMAFVAKDDCSPWTWGVGIYGIGGFSTNFPASSLAGNPNPILLPQPLGIGRVYSQAEIYQVAPTISYALTERLSVGCALDVDLAHAQADPLFLAPPNFALGQFTYGPGSGSRYAWGVGFQLGAYYIADSNWRFGLSYKSNQWFEPLRFNSNDQAGNPVLTKVSFDLPAVVSAGASYAGFPGWLYAIDVRWFDYDNAAGFKGSGYQADGSVAGLGWNGVVGVANGLQYALTDCLTVRMGYLFIDNPVPDSQTMFNLGTSLIMQHFATVGATYQIRDNFSAHVAYTHGFNASISGPIVVPAGAVPGSSVTAETSADFLTVGCTVLF